MLKKCRKLKRPRLVILECKFPMLPSSTGLSQARVPSSVGSKGLYLSVSGDGLLRGSDGLIVLGTPALAAHPDVSLVPSHHETDQPGPVPISEVNVLPLLRPAFTYHH